MILEPVWLELARARADAGEFDVPAWESQNAEVKRIWKQLTSSSNLKGLEELSLTSTELNSTAQETVRRALQACVDECANGESEVDP